MIARTELALLLLDERIIHMHIVLHRCQVFMSEQFLQRKGVIAQNQVADRKGVPQNVRTDALVGDASPLLDAGKQERHPVGRQRPACLREEEMIFSGTAPGNELLLVWSMTIQVVQQVAQAVAPQCQAPFLVAFAFDNN